MTYVNQANYFGFDFQTTTTKKKGLLFIVDSIFLTALVKKKKAKILCFILVRIKAIILYNFI